MVDLGLVVHVKLVLLNSLTQIAFKLQALFHCLLHTGQKELGGVFARSLGAIHRRIGMPDHITGQFIPHGEHGNSDTGGNELFMTIDQVGLKQ